MAGDSRQQVCRFRPDTHRDEQSADPPVVYRAEEVFKVDVENPPSTDVSRGVGNDPVVLYEAMHVALAAIYRAEDLGQAPLNQLRPPSWGRDRPMSTRALRNLKLAIVRPMTVEPVVEILQINLKRLRYIGAVMQAGKNRPEVGRSPDKRAGIEMSSFGQECEPAKGSYLSRRACPIRC